MPAVIDKFGSLGSLKQVPSVAHTFFKGMFCRGRSVPFRWLVLVMTGMALAGLTVTRVTALVRGCLGASPVSLLLGIENIKAPETSKEITSFTRRTRLGRQAT